MEIGISQLPLIAVHIFTASLPSVYPPCFRLYLFVLGLTHVIFWKKSKQARFKRHPLRSCLLCHLFALKDRGYPSLGLRRWQGQGLWGEVDAGTGFDADSCSGTSTPVIQISWVSSLVPQTSKMASLGCIQESLLHVWDTRLVSKKNRRQSSESGSKGNRDPDMGEHGSLLPIYVNAPDASTACQVSWENTLIRGVSGVGLLL